MAKQTAPRGLGASGKRIWGQITETYTLRPDELSILEDACREADLIDRLEEALTGAPLMESGSMGQKVASPLVSEIRQHRNTKRQLLTSLRLPEEPGGSAAEERSEMARALNVIRWGARGTKSG